MDFLHASLGIFRNIVGIGLITVGYGIGDDRADVLLVAGSRHCGPNQGIGGADGGIEYINSKYLVL